MCLCMNRNGAQFVEIFIRLQGTRIQRVRYNRREMSLGTKESVHYNRRVRTNQRKMSLGTDKIGSLKQAFTISGFVLTSFFLVIQRRAWAGTKKNGSL